MSKLDTYADRWLNSGVITVKEARLNLMDFATYTRKPFKVEAIEITEENIFELAEFIGTVRKKEDGTPYIHVDKRLIPNVFRVYPGFFMTRMGDNVRCYSPKIFKDQFELVTVTQVTNDDEETPDV